MLGLKSQRLWTREQSLQSHGRRESAEVTWEVTGSVKTGSEGSGGTLDALRLRRTVREKLGEHLGELQRSWM